MLLRIRESNMKSLIKWSFTLTGLAMLTFALRKPTSTDLAVLGRIAES